MGNKGHTEFSRRSMKTMYDFTAHHCVLRSGRGVFPAAARAFRRQGGYSFFGALLALLCAAGPLSAEPAKARRDRSNAAPSDFTTLNASALLSVSTATNIPFVLFDPGTETIVPYEKFGQFQNLGAENYRYVIWNAKGLSQAVGQGIFPNTVSVRKDPLFQKFYYLKKLEGNHWDFVHNPDPRLSFYKWAIAQENPGVKLYFTALSLERLGQWQHAVKAYQACIVHFPGSYGMTFWNSPWYVGPAALDRLQFILRSHAELGLKLVDAQVNIVNGLNSSVQDDRVVCNPGKLIKVKPSQVVDAPKPLLKPRAHVKGESVRLVRFANGHWQLFIKGKPFPVRGISYQPNKVGLSPDNGTLKPTEDWMTSDFDKNGRIDGPFDSWVDANRNNFQDVNEPVVGDFKLLKDMGVNTLRLYHHAHNRELLDVLYSTYGIRVIMGDLLGAYTVGSGADWYQGTDYADPIQRGRMMESVKKMVTEYKDHPGVLMWMLGNENVYGVATNAPQKPKEFFTFVNEAAKWIKSVDKNHPVAIASGDLYLLDYFAAHTPDVDIFGCNAYRGNHGFGQSLWGTVKRVVDKPVIITEYGCPARHKDLPQLEAEELQAKYLLNVQDDIEANMAGHGFGNALGGVLFTWVDEWWKAGTPPQFDPAAHDTVGQWQGPFLDGWMYEEWLGVAGQGDGQSSPYLRQLRKAYFSLKDRWRQTVSAYQYGQR